MANSDRPQGLRPYGRVRQVQELVAGAACFPGDCVQMQSDGKVDPAAAGASILGVALSYASADGAKVLVSTHPEQLYVVQCDGAAIDAQTDVGNNGDILATAGNSTYKVSRQEIDTTTIAAAAAQLTILQVSRETNNDLGGFVDVIVRINEHQISGVNAFAGI